MADQLIKKDSVRKTGRMDKTGVESFVGKAMRGDRDALYSLCQAIANRVLFRASCRLNNQQDAEDATQEILIRVCSKIRELKNEEAFGGWLNSIIMNETNRYLVNNTKHGIVLDIDDYLESVVDETGEALPDDFAIRSEDRTEIMEIVKQLPDRQLEAVMLHYYEDMSITETAVAMGVRKQSVISYLVTARSKIKNSIQLQSKKMGTAYNLSLLPMGGLLPQVLHQEADIAPLAQEKWVENAVNNTSEKPIGSVAKTRSAGIISGVIAFVLIAVVAIIAVVVGLHDAEEVPEVQDYSIAQPESMEAVGAVLFAGGKEGYEYINPKHAVAQTDSKHGELIIHDWKITVMGDAEVLFGGKGGDADEALLALTSSGEEGEYMLIFSLEDADGGTYTLSHSFFIDR